MIVRRSRYLPAYLPLFQPAKTQPPTRHDSSWEFLSTSCRIFQAFNLPSAGPGSITVRRPAIGFRCINVNLPIHPDQTARDGDNAARQIHVAPLQPDGFPLAQARCENDPEQGLGSLSFQRLQEALDLRDLQCVGRYLINPRPIDEIRHVALENLISHSLVEDGVNGGKMIAESLAVQRRASSDALLELG